MPLAGRGLWAEVDLLEGDVATHHGTGVRRWRCLYCAGIFTGSHTRVRAHLLRLRGPDGRSPGISACPRIPDDDFQRLTDMYGDARPSTQSADAGFRAGPSAGAGPSTSRGWHGLGPVHGPSEATPVPTAATGPSSGPGIPQERAGSVAGGTSRPTSSSAAGPTHHGSSSAADAPHSTSDRTREGGAAPSSDAHPSGTSSGHTRPRGPYVQQRGVRPRQQTLDRCGWQREQHARCTRLVGQFFYECGIPFAVADTWVFRELCEQIAAVDATWRPPRREALRGRMLIEEEETITRELSCIRSAWQT